MNPVFPELQSHISNCVVSISKWIPNVYLKTKYIQNWNHNSLQIEQTYTFPLLSELGRTKALEPSLILSSYLYAISEHSYCSHFKINPNLTISHCLCCYYYAPKPSLLTWIIAVTTWLVSLPLSFALYSSFHKAAKMTTLNTFTF